MTAQLQAALDALNACPDAHAVADLLRRHGVRATAALASTARRSCSCPIAAYLIRVGGVTRNLTVGVRAVYVGPKEYPMTNGPAEFIRGQDAELGPRYPDLEAA